MLSGAESIRSYAAEKRFSQSTLERWLRHDDASQTALFEIAEKLRLGENHLRDVLDDAEDIAARRGMTVASVLMAGEIREVLDRKIGRNEAVKVLKTTLRRLRYPRLTATEARLRDLVTRLSLPRGVRFRFADDLSNSMVSVSLEVQSIEQLRTHAQALVRLAARPEAEEMFRILDGRWE